MLPFLAVVFWFIFFSYVIYGIVRNQNISMTLTEVIIAYGTKILFGCLYGYIFLYSYNGDDTWAMHKNSIDEKHMLLEDPFRFFGEFTPAAAIRNGNGLVDIARLYIMDLEYCLQAKILGIINLISQDNYYINLVFWNFFLFWGHYWLFKLIVKEFPTRRTVYFIVIFLFPPAAFWLSGIRADGLIFLSFSLLLLYFHEWLSTRRLSSLLVSLLGFIGLLIFRPAMAALLIPALISWWVVTRFPQKPFLKFIGVYAVAALVFFLSTLVPSYNMPAVIVQRQQEFMRLRGSSFELDSLQPTVKSFAVIFPQAAANTFLRPYAWEAKGILQWMSVLEIIAFWGIFILLLLRHENGWKNIISHPLVLVFIFVSTSLYLFIGYTIPFPGAIVRYKIIGELILLLALLSTLKIPRSLRLN